MNLFVSTLQKHNRHKASQLGSAVWRWQS